MTHRETRDREMDDMRIEGDDKRDWGGTRNTCNQMGYKEEDEWTGVHFKVPIMSLSSDMSYGGHTEEVP